MMVLKEEKQTARERGFKKPARGSRWEREAWEKLENLLSLKTLTKIQDGLQKDK